MLAALLSAETKLVEYYQHVFRRSNATVVILKRRATVLEYTHKYKI